MKLSRWQLILLGTAYLFLSILKLHDYDRVPEANHAEELLYSWSGIHLIQTGVPQSWSTLDYPSLTLPAKLYRPWVDEPPLYSLLSGGAAHLLGADRNEVIPAGYSRLPSVFASLATMALVFFVAYKFFGYKTGLLAMLFYGLTPTFVFGSRLSVPENITAFFVILCLYLGWLYQKKPNVYYPILFGIFALVLGLMKPTGFFLAPLMMFLAMQKKRWQDAGIILTIMLLGILLFILYGYFINWDLFLQIVSIQGTRFSGWTGLGFTLVTTAYDIFIEYDGWYIFTLISTLFFILKKDKSDKLQLLSLFWMYWLLMVVFSGSEQDLLPWYRYPLFPLMAMFGALGAIEMWKKNNFYTVALIIGMVLTSRFYVHNDFRPTTPSLVFRLTYLLAVLPSLAYMIWKNDLYKRLSKAAIVLFFILGIYFNAKYIYSAFPIKCESKTCPIGESTILSKAQLPPFTNILEIGSSDGMLYDKRPWF
jgi:4-amino-4-deoxy-L-arabinose transferase-like glycosyltransferase